MKIGLIDVDGHNFPNLALMRISAWHKAQGDSVEWWWTDFIHYDIVYKSKIFSDAYSRDVPDPLNADRVYKGGTGYQIKLKDGKEFYDKNGESVLPPEIEGMFPDYSIYPQYDFAVSMTSRGCPRGCPFCIVKDKEGRKSVKVADVDKFWNGQKAIEVCDPNITACKDKRDLFDQYRQTGAYINFNQGLDIRLLNEDDIEDLSNMKLKNLHFAWDNPQDDLLDKFKAFAEQYHGKRLSCGNGTVYVLTGFNSTMEENLYRINKLWELGFYPYVMIYNKPNADRELKQLQRWCNNRFIFKSCKWEDYNR